MAKLFTKKKEKDLEKKIVKEMKIGFKTAIIYTVSYIVISLIIGFLVGFIFSIFYPQANFIYVLVIVFLLALVVLYSFFKVPKTVCCEC